MNNPSAEYLIMKGVITQLPEQSQARVSEAYETLKATVEAYGNEGFLALALLGTELSDKEETQNV